MAAAAAEASGGDSSVSTAYCLDQHARYVGGNSSVFASPGLSAGLFLLSPFAEGREPDLQITMHPWDKYGRVWGMRHQQRPKCSPASAAARHPCLLGPKKPGSGWCFYPHSRRAARPLSAQGEAEARPALLAKAADPEAPDTQALRQHRHSRDRQQPAALPGADQARCPHARTAACEPAYESRGCSPAY